MSSPTTETRAEPTTDLPAITGVRTRVIARGREAVVVEFATGGRVRYRETDDGVEEAWLGPDGE